MGWCVGVTSNLALQSPCGLSWLKSWTLTQTYQCKSHTSLNITALLRLYDTKYNYDVMSQYVGLKPLKYTSIVLLQHIMMWYTKYSSYSHGRTPTNPIHFWEKVRNQIKWANATWDLTWPPEILQNGDSILCFRNPCVWDLWLYDGNYMNFTVRATKIIC